MDTVSNINFKIKRETNYILCKNMVFYQYLILFKYIFVEIILKLHSSHDVSHFNYIFLNLNIILRINNYLHKIQISNYIMISYKKC
jgi:hypothetical protein